jgi:hypothetical protein
MACFQPSFIEMAMHAAAKGEKSAFVVDNPINFQSTKPVMIWCVDIWCLDYLGVYERRDSDWASYRT